jgi:hypothetical protein
MTISVRNIGRRTPPRGREPRSRPSDAPKQPRIYIGMEVVIRVPCSFRGCGSKYSLRHGSDDFYSGVVEQKRGSEYLVVTRLYGSFWTMRKYMYEVVTRGRGGTRPLLVEAEKVDPA